MLKCHRCQEHESLTNLFARVAKAVLLSSFLKCVFALNRMTTWLHGHTILKHLTCWMVFRGGVCVQFCNNNPSKICSKIVIKTCLSWLDFKIDNGILNEIDHKVIVVKLLPIRFQRIILLNLRNYQYFEWMCVNNTNGN